MIWWNGVSSDDLHLYVERYPSRKLPVRKTTFYSVPGRTGDYVYQQNAWENYTQAYDIYISAEDRKLPNAMTAITAWLYSANGYAKLEDSYDLDTYRMAVFEGGQDVENYLNRYGKATIEFNCKPKRWLASGEQFIDLTAAASPNKIEIYNPTGMPSKPYIEFEGSGPILLKLSDGQEFQVKELMGLNSVDFETHEVSVSAYEYPAEKVEDTSTFHLPSSIGSFRFEYELQEDEEGELADVSGMKMKPRWYTL